MKASRAGTHRLIDARLRAYDEARKEGKSDEEAFKIAKAVTRKSLKADKGYTRQLIEECVEGDILDMGIFVCIDPRDKTQGSNTRNVRLSNSYHYTETAGAKVRVWKSLAARRNVARKEY